jgi:hypothetical protein
VDFLRYQETYAVLNEKNIIPLKVRVLKTISTFEKGYASILSNDPSYWAIPRSSRKTTCDLYRIHEGGKKNGLLSWLGNVSLLGLNKNITLLRLIFLCKGNK